MDAVLQNTLRQNALVQDIAGIIKTYYGAKDAVEGVLTGIKKAAYGTFVSVDNRVKQSAANLKDALGLRPPKVKNLSASIDDLNRKLENLERTRKISINVDEIRRTGKQIEKVKAEISNVEKKAGIRKSSGLGSAIKNAAGAVSKGGWIGMAAGGFMDLARAAGDAEDKKLGIKRGPGNTIVSKGLAADPSKTINGQLGTITERMDGVMGQVGLAIQPFISQMLSGLVSLTGMIPNVLSALQPLFDVINSIPLGHIFNDLGASIQSVLQVLQPVLTELKPLLGTVFTIVFSIVDKISQLVQKVMVRFGPVFVKIAEIVSAVLGPALELAGKLFGGLLDAVGWVVDRVGDFIDTIGKLFSTADDGMNQVAETAADREKAKKDLTKTFESGKVKDKDIVAYHRMFEKSFGANVAGRVYKNYTSFTADLDKKNNTHKYSDQAKKVKEIIDTQKAPPVPKVNDQGKGSAAGYGGAEAQAQSDAIVDGGKKSTIINIGKFFDNMNLTAQTMQQGFDDFERRVENIFLRIVNSAG